jgi:5-(carboxyamino)imidazole ribonucleotide synthase
MNKSTTKVLRGGKGGILPGATIGVMGSGQLGRMMAIEAKKLGYRVKTYSPDGDSPTGQVADAEFVGSYEDEAEVRAFFNRIDVLTFEFENVPSSTVAWAEEVIPVRPSGAILHVCQHRLREKEFLRGNGFPCAPFRRVDTAADLEGALLELGRPAVLKTAAFGYDGKGQVKITDGVDASAALAGFKGQTAVLEGWVPFVAEISVMVARGVGGECCVYPVFENVHAHHILDVTICPARIPDSSAEAARTLAVSIAERLGLIGVMAVEMFLMADGQVVVNELAPRPHNSGHLTFDASVTSQFEQQVRAACGLPLGSVGLKTGGAAMVNLLGDEWAAGEPDWESVLRLGDVKVHLYGKLEPRLGRKMGHLTAFGDSAESAGNRVLEARRVLRRE